MKKRHPFPAWGRFPAQVIRNRSYCFWTLCHQYLPLAQAYCYRFHTDVGLSLQPLRLLHLRKVLPCGPKRGLFLRTASNLSIPDALLTLSLFLNTSSLTSLGIWEAITSSAHPTPLPSHVAGALQDWPWLRGPPPHPHLYSFKYCLSAHFVTGEIEGSDGLGMSLLKNNT